MVENSLSYTKPPEPPSIHRRPQFHATQVIGVPIIVCIALVGLFNVFDGSASIVLRVILIYATLLIGLRMLGKREFSQLSPLELITLLLVPEIVSSALQEPAAPLANAIFGVAALFALVFLTSLISHYFPPFERLVVGSPTILVSQGRFIETNLNKERITPDEIYAELHRIGLYELSQVKWAVLEEDGKIAVIPEQGQAIQIAPPENQPT